MKSNNLIVRLAMSKYILTGKFNPLNIVIDHVAKHSYMGY